MTDAHTLPGNPGVGFLKTAAGDLIRFQAAFVSGPRPQPHLDHWADTPVPRVFTAAAPVAVRDVRAEQRTPTVLAAVLDRVAGRGLAAHPVWLPPIAASPTLDLLVQPGGRHELSVPIGLVDSPFEQRHDPLVAQLATANVAVVGAPQAGKSTAVRTLVLRPRGDAQSRRGRLLLPRFRWRCAGRARRAPTRRVGLR